MRKELLYTDGAVRWDLVAAMFPTTMRRGWRRSVNILARELIGLAAQGDEMRDGADSRDALTLVVDAEFVGRAHHIDKSSWNALEREHNPFPSPAAVMRKLTPWWDTVMGRDHMEETFDAYPSGREVYDNIFATHNAIWDGERDAGKLYDSMLARLLTAAFDELCLTLWGDDVIAAAREAGIYNQALDGHGDD